MSVYAKHRKTPGLAALTGLLVVFGVLVWPRLDRAVSEWEVMTAPLPVQDAKLNAVSGSYNPQLGGYFVFAAGTKTVSTQQKAVMLTYDRFNWRSQVLFTTGLPQTRDILGVATFLQDNGAAGPSPEDLLRVWAVGEAVTPLTSSIIIYSQTNSQTGSSTKWGECIGDATQCPSQPIRCGAGSCDVGHKLNAVDFYDANTGVAVGDDCTVLRTSDGGRNWALQPAPAGCAGNNLTAVKFARDFSSSVPASAVERPRRPAAWIAASNQRRVWFSNNAGSPGTGWTQYNRTRIAADPQQTWYDLTALYDGAAYHVWLIGVDSTTTASSSVEYLSCATCGGTPGPSFVSGGTINTPAANSSAVSSTYDPRLNTYSVWVGSGSSSTDGAILYSSNPTDGAGATWIKQGIGTTQSINSLDAVNPAHAWAVGNQGTLLRLSPGNITGWAWVGADSCSTICSPTSVDPFCTVLGCGASGNERVRPIGWMSLNCANSAVCQSQTFNYGLNLKQKLGATCTAASEDTDVGAFSGYAWLGVTDPSQIDPTIPAGDPQDCLNNPAACRPIGWLAFDRRDTGDPPGPPFDTLPFTTACGKTVAAGSPQDYVTASFDYATAKVEGWGRFVGVDFITNDRGWVKLRGPYRCGTAACSLNRTIDCSGQPSNYCNSLGWGKCDTELASSAYYGSCPVTSPATATGRERHYLQCNDCTTNTNGPGDADDTLACNICKHVQTTDWWNNSFQKRRSIVVSNATGTAEADAGVTAELVTDLNPLVSGDTFPFNEVHLVYRGTVNFTELDREIVQLPGGLERIRFKLVQPIAATKSDTGYYLYYDPNVATPAPLSDPRRVYTYWEDFSDPSVFANEWTVYAAAGNPCQTAFAISSGRLRKTADINGDCIAYNTHYTLYSQNNYSLEAQLYVDGVGDASIRMHDISDTFTAPNSYGYWMGLTRFGSAIPNNEQIFVRNKAGSFSAGMSTPVVNTNYYNVKWDYTYHSDSDRVHVGTKEGEPTPFTPPTDTHTNFFTGFFYPGLSTYQSFGRRTRVRWDDYHIWQTSSATVVPPGAVESYPPAAPPDQPLEPWSCNKCGTTAGRTQCGIGRCIPTAPANPYDVCLNDAQCRPVGSTLTGLCQPVGHCSTDGSICQPGFLACAGGATCLGAGDNVCNACDSCALYGISIDAKGGSVFGFGYAQDFGFVDFSGAFLYNRSWLQVLRGNIYARGDVGNPQTKPVPVNAQPQRCNATYAVRSNGAIQNFCSTFQTTSPQEDATTSPYLRPGYSQLDLPSGGNQFTTAIDRLDLNTLLTDAFPPFSVNKYYQQIVEVTDPAYSRLSDFIAQYGGPSCLGNKVYYFKYIPLIVDIPWDFRPCVYGGGTFVIEGADLTINADLTYSTLPSPQKITEIPAAGFIIIKRRGVANPAAVKLEIASNVQQTVGNFFVEGEILSQGTGLQTIPDKQLTNQGVMVASKFTFLRRYKGTIDNPQPSEVILNDGRLTLNPPPGFQSFAKILPSFRESRP